MSEYVDIYVEEMNPGESFVHSDGESYEISGIEERKDVITFWVECLSSTEGADHLVFRYGDTVKGSLS